MVHGSEEEQAKAQSVLENAKSVEAPQTA